MKKTLVVAALLAAVIIACRQTDRSASSLLNTARLTPQLFTVDIAQDTVLYTRKGAIIRLPKGTLEATGTQVQLEVREAYSMEDIIAAGLTTLSNGQPLSSGGMFYLNAVGENAVRITKGISIATPTSFIDPAMQLFKGTVNPDSTINWVDPQPLPPNPQQASLTVGKALFDDNCATCHRIDKDLTGPALAHVVKRSAKGGEMGLIDLYAFTRNCNREIARSPYYCTLYEQWNKTPMNLFPVLSDRDLDALYAYIENESDRLRLPVPDNGILRRLDSCHQYQLTAGNLESRKQQLLPDSVSMVSIQRDTSIDRTVIEKGEPAPPPPVDYDQVAPGQTLYYQFNIEAFGWYNVDLFVKEQPGVTQSTLIVRMQGSYREAFQLYIAIPDWKVLSQGRPLTTGKDQYSFYSEDGNLPLPRGARAWVFAVGEKDSTILFADTSFVIGAKQELSLSLARITQAQFQQAIRRMSIPGIKLQVEATQTGIELRTVISELKQAEQLKPKAGNCDCWEKTRRHRREPANKLPERAAGTIPLEAIE